MSKRQKVVCLGDLMTELILPTSEFLQVNRTCVVRGRPYEIGGTAFNLSWHLARWRESPNVVAFYGNRQRELVQATFAAAMLDSTNLLSVDGETDQLLVLRNSDDFVAVYVLGELPSDFQQRIKANCENVELLILTGSRHPEVRQVCAQVAEGFSGKLLAFSPSYAIYEYEPENLRRTVMQAGVTQLNAREAEYAAGLLRFDSVVDFAKSLPGSLLVTRACEGLRTFERSQIVDTPSRSHSKEDIIGAGDVFFAAVLYRMLNDQPLFEAIRFGVCAAAYFVDAQPSDTRQVRLEIPVKEIHKRVEAASLHFSIQ
jgi:sugar/nucleoside kinase (ribokinase family)